MLTLRRVLAVVILLAVLFLGSVVWRHLNNQPVQEVLRTLPQEIDLALDNLHYTETEDGRQRWTLTADRAEYLRGSHLVRLAPVKLVFYDAGAFGELTLHADQGELQEDIRQVDVWGNVVVTTARGEKLVTDSLRYEEQGRRLSTAASIHYTAPRQELTGTGLLIDLEKNTLLVEKDVTMQLLPDPKETPGED